MYYDLSQTPMAWTLMFKLASFIPKAIPQAVPPEII